MFKNKDSVFTREIESIPRRIYSGFIESQVYHTMSSKKRPLNQENVWTLFSPKCFSRFLKENPDVHLVGTAMQNAKIAGDIIQELGGGTDQQTKMDKWMDSAFFSWNIVMLNGFSFQFV